MSVVIETQESCPHFLRLKSELLNRPDGVVLYEDPIFQPRFTILFNRYSKADFHPSEIIWSRPGQLNKHPCLVSPLGWNNIKVFGGRLSPKWFSTLFALLQEKKLLDLVVPNLYDQNTFNQNPNILTPTSMSYCGAFVFRFRRGGVVEDIVVDDRLPTTTNCHLLTAISMNVDEFLPALMEKAYAKFVGGYYNLEQINYLTALMDFTGGFVETYSIRGNELLTDTEMELFFDKLDTLVGDSFAFCQSDKDPFKNSSSNNSMEIHFINDFNKIPNQPPNDVLEYFLYYFNHYTNEFILLVRLPSLFSGDIEDSYVKEKQINRKWNDCGLLVSKKFGISYNDNRENWVPVEELPYFCDKIVILHMVYRNSIIAFAKKQVYWKFFFFESFWHRDGPRGDLESLGDEFLKNNQYLCAINTIDGCHIKIVLTITQKYVDSGPNSIRRAENTKTGITILEVERNRQYILRDLEDVRNIQSHIDSYIDRVTIISTFLELGRYIVIPWISAGGGTRYSLQLFSSALDTEIRQLDNDFPSVTFCVPCKIKQAVFQTRRSFSSIYQKQPEQSTNMIIQRKTYNQESQICAACRSIYPKRATRISVLHVEILETHQHYKFPSLYFIISFDNETYKSRIIDATFHPSWQEHFIFYRNMDSDSRAKIEIFAVGALGLKSALVSRIISENELRENGHLYIDICIPTLKENVSIDCKLVMNIKEYLP